MKIFKSPFKEYAIAAIVFVSLAVDFVFPHLRIWWLVFAAALLGSVPVFWRTFVALRTPRITIDTFNSFALLISFIAVQVRSAAFIVLMLTFADLLDWRTEVRTREAQEELLRLKPQKAVRERGREIEEIPASEVKSGDVLVVENGSSVPVDGIVVSGKGYVNESLLTGESAPVEKVVGDPVFSSTVNESGLIKIRVTKVGKDSTIERMAALMREASGSKSHSERLADRFAAVFLPIVLILGIAVYFWTKNILMTAALFLVACADDMAVAIPLAITASLGRAAKRGVIIKGGEPLENLAKMKTLILDKTGTLTYGAFSVRDVWMTLGVREADFWRCIAIGEKFSEHPVGRAIMKKAAKYTGDVPDPDNFEVYRGSGVGARFGKRNILIGDEDLLISKKIKLTSEVVSRLAEGRAGHGETTVIVVLNKKILGTISVADLPRVEARSSLEMIKRLGIKDVVMFTGDRAEVARRVAGPLGIVSFKSSMKPEDKLRSLENMELSGGVAMVGDGINDAPALARADVGIAMGGEGAAIASEAADIIILTDNLGRLPEMILLGRRTFSVVRSDMVIWFLSNLVGFALVLTGFAGPALAAFYNFATDFLPLINSARLFRS